MVREFFTADIKSIESVGAVRAVFEQVFFRFCEFFAGFILAETVKSLADLCGLIGEDSFLVVRAIEERHKPLFPCETLIDEKIFLVMAHQATDVNGFYSPTILIEFIDYKPTENLLVDGIV